MKENKRQLGNGSRAHLVIQADSAKSTDDTFHILFHSYQLVDDVRGIEHVKTFTINAAEKEDRQVA